MKEILNGLLSDAQSLTESSAIVVAGVFLISRWVRSGFAPVVAAGCLVVGAFVIYGVQNFDKLGDAAKVTIEQHQPGPPAGPALDND